MSEDAPVYPARPGSKEGSRGTSAAAGKRVDADTLRKRVMETLGRHPRGLTADEVADVLGLSVLSVRPRVSELKAMGRVEKTTQRRRNTSGASAAVWCVRTRQGRLDLVFQTQT